MQYFLNSQGIIIVREIITSIKGAKEFLSRIDGEIGDGDHGINMYKGFNMAEAIIKDTDSFTDGVKVLSQVLLMEIGGSMGPLYGSFFKSIYRVLKDKEQIFAVDLLSALDSAINSIKELGKAQVGDKTMIDTLSPAIDALRSAIRNNYSFSDSLINFMEAAKEGMESTRNMVAKIGRSSRLGERSVGVLDAGAVSCYIILESLGKSVIDNIRET